MSDHNFWLSDAQFARLQPLLPNKVRGVPRVDDRRVISGIIHVIRNGLMWRDAPSCYGPHMALYNRFVRWSKAGGGSLRNPPSDQAARPEGPADSRKGEDNRFSPQQERRGK